MVAVKRYYPVLPTVPKNSSERSKTVFRAAQWLRRQIIQRVEHRRRHKVLRCSPSFLVGLQQQQSISFSAVNIFLSITAFLGNSLILVALSRETSLHPPSKLLYRCLATADLLVGLVSQPLDVTYWISLVHEPWLESLSIRKGWSPDIKLCVVWGVFVDVDGHKRG